jgi:hypothetical protein
MGFPGSGDLRLNRVEVRGKRGTSEPFLILHLSDLHGRSLGPGQSLLKEILEGMAPDFVFLTGDILDEHTATMSPVLSFISALPPGRRFFVAGNHDPRCPLYPQLQQALSDAGIEPLVNRSVLLSTGGAEGRPAVRVIGLDDVYHGEPDFSLLESFLPDQAGAPSIVATHSPTLGRRNARRVGEASILSLAARSGADLVLCGHTHGGQVNLPWIGAVYVPGQKLLPKLVHGVYTSGATSMYVTSGLGTSHVPMRFLCPPEAALIAWYP